MSKMKALLENILEDYDMNGLTIMEVVNKYKLPEEQVIQILSDYSETFA
jgi:hypothetical protein